MYAQAPSLWDWVNQMRERRFSRECKIIAFGIAGTDLTTMQFGNDVDFDKESDELIEKNRNSESNIAFEYVPNFGFDEIDTKAQTWFKF